MQSSSFTDSLLSFFLEQQGSKTQVSVCLVKLLKLLILIYTSALKLSTPYTEHCMFLRIPINSHVFFCHKKMNIFLYYRESNFHISVQYQSIVGMENDFSVWSYFKTFFPSIIYIKNVY